MQITLIHPHPPFDDHIKIPWTQLPNVVKELLVVELYKADCLTFTQAQQLLNHSSWQETLALLEQRGCSIYYDRDDFAEDLTSCASLLETEIPQ